MKEAILNNNVHYFVLNFNIFASTKQAGASCGLL